MLVPEDAIGDGPHIYIALPENYFEHVPVNATRLLWEWEANVDPIASLKSAARNELPVQQGWGWGRWFVEPSWRALGLADEAIHDDDLPDLLEDASGYLGGGRRPGRP